MFLSKNTKTFSKKIVIFYNKFRLNKNKNFEFEYKQSLFFLKKKHKTFW